MCGVSVSQKGQSAEGSQPLETKARAVFFVGTQDAKLGVKADNDIIDSMAQTGCCLTSHATYHLTHPWHTQG